MLVYLRVTCVMLWFVTALAVVNPGFKARITTLGLNYANNVAIEALKKEVQKTTIPDQSGKASGFKYEVKNMHVTAFTPPSSQISITPGKGLSWVAQNADIQIHGDFHYKKWFVSDGGSFDAKLKGVSFNIGIDIDKDSNGRPSIASRQCTNSIGDVDFKFHGGMAWLYNLFKGKVGDIIKGSLKGQLCKLLVKEINEDGENKLKKLHVTTPLAKEFLLDYRLTKNPAFTPGYLETYHKGEIFWLSAPTTESQLTPPPMSDNMNDTNHMMYLWVSDYIFDTMGQVAQTHGVLVYNLTAKDLPASSRGVLNTTCEGFIPKCIGKIIPQIGAKYANSMVELRMASSVAPTMKITTSGINIQCAGDIRLYVHVPGRADTPFLMTLAAKMSTTVNVSIVKELLYAKVENLSVKLKAQNSTVGNISDAFLDFLVKQALNVFLIPKLNDLGQKGFPLPMTGDIQFVGTKLAFLQDAMVVMTNLTYTPGGYHDDTLRFKPMMNYRTDIVDL